MDIEKFKDLEKKFNALKQQADKGKIDSVVLNKELKKMMVMDSDGSYWIIGGNSGKWYKYNGKDWKEDNPYKAEHIHKDKLANTTNIIKNDLSVSNKESSEQAITNKKTESMGNIENTVICVTCKSKISNHEIYCHICGKNQKYITKDKKNNEIPELLISSVNLVSLIFFFGGIGIIIGVVFGAIIGIFKDIPIYIELPQMLNDLRSNILGGILFAILGGLAGFIIFAVKFVFFGSIFNIVSFFFGGIRFKTKITKNIE